MKAELEKLRELAVKATPGPWKFGRTGDEQRMILGGSSERYIASVQIQQTPRQYGLHSEPDRLANAAFIAAADPTTIIALIDALISKDTANG